MVYGVVSLPTRGNLGTTGKALEHPWNKTLVFRGVFQCLPEVKAIESLAFLERAMGIEPTSEAWEALDKTMKAIDLVALSFLGHGLSWKLDGNGVHRRACLGRGTPDFNRSMHFF